MLKVLVRPRIGKFALQNRLGKPAHKGRGSCLEY
jgi:hypothetical protein